MAEKDFAKMTQKELEEYCDKHQKELDTALCFLRNKKLANNKHSN